MINDKLQKKIDFALKLLKSIPSDDIELCFSGGKDSSVILQLAKMAGIKYTAVYKNTTFDPKGTTSFCKANGCDVLMPKMTFLQIVEKKGFPTRRARFCCEILKEYKYKDKVILGVRQFESKKRNEIYQEPEQCVVYGKSKKQDNSNVVQQYYPINTWTDKDVYDFVCHYKIKLHPTYYNMSGEIMTHIDKSGVFRITKRLGCVGCPISGSKKQKAEFKDNPKYFVAYMRAGLKYWNDPNKQSTNAHKTFETIYDLFYHNVFCRSYADYCKKVGRNGLFPQVDCKKYLEEYFNVKLP